MADKDRLKEVIKDSGMTITAIAKKSDIKRPTLYYKLSKDTADFTGSEIQALSKVLRLTKAQREQIFLR